MQGVNYNKYIKDMLKAGYTWAEIEYYWRNPEEFEEEKNETLTNKQKEQSKYWQKLKNI